MSSLFLQYFYNNEWAIYVGKHRLRFKGKFTRLYEDGRNIVVTRFVDDGYTYDVVWNKFMGERLLINNADGFVRDMPFNLATAHFLPNGIEVDCPDSVLGTLVL